MTGFQVDRANVDIVDEILVTVWATIAMRKPDIKDAWKNWSNM